MTSSGEQKTFDGSLIFEDECIYVLTDMEGICLLSKKWDGKDALVFATLDEFPDIKLGKYCRVSGLYFSDIGAIMPSSIEAIDPPKRSSGFCGC